MRLGFAHGHRCSTSGWLLTTVCNSLQRRMQRLLAPVGAHQCRSFSTQYNFFTQHNRAARAGAQLSCDPPRRGGGGALHRWASRLVGVVCSGPGPKSWERQASRHRVQQPPGQLGGCTLLCGGIQLRPSAFAGATCLKPLTVAASHSLRPACSGAACPGAYRAGAVGCIYPAAQLA